LPETRTATTHKFDIAGHEGYLTVGLFENGQPGELFITMAKEGSTIGGLMDAIGTLTSIALQYGVPMEALARKTLDGLSVRTVKSIRQTVSSLSGGQRQTVAIARAVLWNSKVVILDEPTAALGVAQTEQVLNLVRRLADNGLAVVLISHNLNDVFEVADNIAALYLGNMAAQVNKNEVIPRQVIELITTGKSAGVDAPSANSGATK
jgi:ABC-type sugar transport system ATPase subunit